MSARFVTAYEAPDVHLQTFFDNYFGFFNPEYFYDPIRLMV